MWGEFRLELEFQLFGGRGYHIADGGEGTSVDGSGAVFSQRGEMFGRAVGAVVVESVFGIEFVVFFHYFVAVRFS